MPPSDAFRLAEELDRPEPRYPLDVAFCEDCKLVQITETLPPDLLFGERYVYFSSVSPQLLEHARRNVENQVSRFALDEHSQVIELASNDGYLLQYYDRLGIPVLGIDPAPAQCEAARQLGITTLCDFFSLDLAEKLHHEGTLADVVHGNNVLAHVADIHGFVAGIEHILKPEGVAVLEVPYLGDTLTHCEFDTIYHEHLCYFSVHALIELFSRHGLTLFDLERLDIHGGSLRLYLAKAASARASRVRGIVAALLEQEVKEGMTALAGYRHFASRVESLKSELRQLLDGYKNKGCRMAGYGAAAKGTILLNYVGIDASDLDFIADLNPHKHGRYMPGVGIPIRGVDALLTEQPDITLLLPWNFSDEILKQQQEYRSRGGRFIIPIPTPRVV